LFELGDLRKSIATILENRFEFLNLFRQIEATFSTTLASRNFDLTLLTNLVTCLSFSPFMILMAWAVIPAPKF
jgi:hypothetical protein